ERTAALRAEGREDLAAAVDIDVDLAQAHLSEAVHRGFAPAIAAEVHRVVPGEAGTAARAVEAPIIGTAWREAAIIEAGWPNTTGSAVIGSGLRPGEAEVVAAEAAGTVANPHDGRETVAPRRLRQETNLVAAILDFEVEAFDIAVGERGVAFAAIVARILAR